MYPRSGGGAVLYEGHIYVFGGYTGEKKRSKSIEVYDPFKNYWETLNVYLTLFRSNSIEGSKLV